MKCPICQTWGRITSTQYKSSTDENGNKNFYYEQTYVCGNAHCSNYKKIFNTTKTPIDVVEE